MKEMLVLIISSHEVFLFPRGIGNGIVGLYDSKTMRKYSVNKTWKNKEYITSYKLVPNILY